MASASTPTLYGLDGVKTSLTVHDPISLFLDKENNILNVDINELLDLLKHHNIDVDLKKDIQTKI